MNNVIDELDELAIRYCESYNDVDFDTARRSFANFPNNVISNSKIIFMFLRLSDNNFKLINDNPFELFDSSFLRDCYLDNGKNIHLLKAFGNCTGFRKLIDDLVIINNPETITFYRDDFRRIHTVYKRR